MNLFTYCKKGLIQKQKDGENIKTKLNKIKHPEIIIYSQWFYKTCKFGHIFTKLTSTDHTYFGINIRLYLYNTYSTFHLWVYTLGHPVCFSFFFVFQNINSIYSKRIQKQIFNKNQTFFK